MVAAPPAHAQTPLTEHTFRPETHETPGTLDLADAAWLVGTWTGSGFGGTVEEVWLPPAHGQMIGMFRHYTDAEAGFSEIMSLGAGPDGGTLLRVKHFSPEFEGWEEKDESVDFRFIRADADALYFSGLTLRREGADALKIYIAMDQGGDGIHEAVLEYTRGAG